MTNWERKGCPCTPGERPNQPDMMEMKIQTKIRILLHQKLHVPKEMDAGMSAVSGSKMQQKPSQNYNEDQVFVAEHPLR